MQKEITTIKMPSYGTGQPLPESLVEICPSSSGSINWDRIMTLPWFQPMGLCPQDKVYHAEGDVLTHTKLCCEWLTRYSGWKNLSEMDRRIVFLAVLFHDVGKPLCTRVDGEMITSKGHSTIGEGILRQFLYEHGVDPITREEIASLVRFHQTPFHFLGSECPEKSVIRISLNCRCDLISLVAMADMNGRKTEKLAEGIEQAEMFRAYADDLLCLDRPYPFLRDPLWEKFAFFYLDRPLMSGAYDTGRLDIYMMTGLPASGKDWYISNRFEGMHCISLDGLREEMNLPAPHGTPEVIREAKLRSVGLMRKAEPFVFNATSLTRKLRQEWIEFFGGYSARVHICHIETEFNEMNRRNRARRSPVPEEVMENMRAKWQVPGFDEGYEVAWILN